MSVSDRKPLSFTARSGTQRARRPPQSESVNALDWDHNAYYHRLLLRHLLRPCKRVLDVGCGAGAFAVELAKRAERVDALDRSPAMIEEARRVAPPNVTCILADLLQDPLHGAGYDAIVSLSALHHTPLPEVLPRLAGALRPGGVLAAVALPRRDLPLELPAELTAAIGHRLFGTAFAILRTFDRGRWYAMEPNHAIMPVVLDPSLATAGVGSSAWRTCEAAGLLALLPAVAKAGRDLTRAFEDQPVLARTQPH